MKKKEYTKDDFDRWNTNLIILVMMNFALTIANIIFSFMHH